MSKSKDLINLIPENAYSSLTDKKKFALVIHMIKIGDITGYKDLKNQIELLGWNTDDFLRVFKDLWKSGEVGWDELDVLDVHNVKIKSPGFIGDKWILNNLGQDQLCQIVPKEYWGKVGYCKACKQD